MILRLIDADEFKKRVPRVGGGDPVGELNIVVDLSCSPRRRG